MLESTEPATSEAERLLKEKILTHIHEARTKAFEDGNEDAMAALDAAYREISAL